MTIARLPSPKLTLRSRRRPLNSVDLLAMAHGFAGAAKSWPGLDDPPERCWRTIAATDWFEAWVVAWPIGGAIELHDHGLSSGAIVVASGTLVETSVRLNGGELGTTSAEIQTGGHVTFGSRHVHDLSNYGPSPALSVHVYSPALERMTYFRWGGNGHRLVSVRTDEYREGLLVG